MTDNQDFFCITNLLFNRAEIMLLPRPVRRTPRFGLGLADVGAVTVTAALLFASVTWVATAVMLLWWVCMYACV